VGLGAPYWDPEARGILTGITRGTGRAHLARAVLEAACYQTRDIVQAMQADAGTPISKLRVDGGMTRNDFLARRRRAALYFYRRRASRMASVRRVPRSS